METIEFLRGLVDAEARLLDRETGETGHKRVCYWRTESGVCCCDFHSSCGGFGESGKERPGAFFGMSGWLPFEQQLNSMMNFQGMRNDRVYETEDEYREDKIESNDEDESSQSDDRINISFSDAESDNSAPEADENLASFDPFQLDRQGSPQNNITDALNFVRDILNLQPVVTGLSAPGEDGIDTTDELTTEAFPTLQTPISLSYGSADPKVSVHLGREMTELPSKKMKIDVTWKAYEGFGHWYKVPSETDDILEFPQQKIGLPVEASS